MTSVLKQAGVLIALLALNQWAIAAQAPDAGRTLQQIPAVPAPIKAAPEIHVEQGGAPVSASDGMKIEVKSLRITGAQVYTEAELLAATGFKPGETTLSGLRALAAKIADHYHSHGYFVAQAILPAQDIKDGAVTIAVLEGRYGKVSLNNQSNLSGAVTDSLLGDVNSGDAIATAPLERGLLLLSDLPGIEVKSTLVPGASAGTSDLLIDVTPGKRISGSVDADNQGNRYTGANRIGATVNINDPAGHGDVLSLRALTGTGLDYLRPSYQIQFGKVRAGAAYADMRYKLGSDFASLRANGHATITSLFGSYPLIRSRNTNLTVQLDCDAKTFQDKVDSTATITDKKARVWMAGLNGNHRDTLGGGGFNEYFVTWTSGTLDLQSPAALAVDSATARSNGSYGKLAWNASRLQSVTGTVTLSAALNGQFASKNLDNSEKMGLGGANAVRAYPEGEAYGDEGYVLNLEAKKLLTGIEGLPGQMQLVGFVDTGSITLNKSPWAAGVNRRTLSGAGIGINWTDSASFVIKAYYAHKVGSAVATSAPDAASRFWVQGVKYF